MRPRPTLTPRAWRATTLSALAGGASVVDFACTTDYQKGLDDPNYGQPNALNNERQPEGRSGAGSSSGDGGAGGSSIVCVANGGTQLEAGECAVSFKDQVLPALGRSTCAQTSCHGGPSPPSPPRIEPSDPGAMWAEFAAYKMNTGGTPYVNPCSKDKAESGIACNLYANNPCGVKMPLGGTPQVPEEDIQLIEQWIECGAPNN